MNTTTSLTVMRRSRPLPSVVVICIALAAGSALLVKGFTLTPNLTNIGLQASILLMLSMPMTLVIMSEGLDLSVGALLSLCSVVLAQSLLWGHGIVFSLGLSMLVGLLFGLFNGVLVAHLALPPFVVTLGTFGVAQGAALVLTDGNSVAGFGPAISSFYASSIGGIPLPVLIAGGCWLATHILLYHTRFGTYIFAIGGNRDALVLAGVRAPLYHIGIYALTGLVVGVTALLLTGRMNSAHPTGAIGMEFDAIAAVVLGGTAFEKADGWLLGTVMGVLTICILRNMLNLLGIESSLQMVSIGILVLLVILIDSWNKTRKGARK